MRVATDWRLRYEGLLEVLDPTETALQQSRGVWRAAAVVAKIVSAVVTVLGWWVGR